MKDNLIIVEHPLIKRDVTILRDRNTESETFRAVLQRVSNLLAAEVSKNFSLSNIIIETPLEVTEGSKLTNEVILVPVLRAGLGMVDGIRKLVPNAKVGHIGLYRDHDTLEPVEYYSKLPPDVDKRLVIVLDPMLATGGSVSAAIGLAKKYGAKHIKLMSIVGTQQGIDFVLKNHPDVEIYIGIIDEKLNDKGYIVPGLGDAGDRLFGTI